MQLQPWKRRCVSIHRFVHKGHSLTLARDLRHFIELDKNNLDIEEYDNAKRQRPGRKSGDAAQHTGIYVRYSQKNSLKQRLQDVLDVVLQL